MVGVYVSPELKHTPHTCGCHLTEPSRALTIAIIANPRRFTLFFCQSVCFLSSVILWSFFLLELAIKFTSCWTINTRWHTFPWKREQNRSQSYKKWQRKLDLGTEKKREPFHRSHSKQCINEMVLGVEQCNGVDIAAAVTLKLHFMPWREDCVCVEYVVCHVQNAEKSWDDIFIRK